MCQPERGNQVFLSHINVKKLKKWKPCWDLSFRASWGRPEGKLFAMPAGSPKAAVPKSESVLYEPKCQGWRGDRKHDEKAEVYPKENNGNWPRNYFFSFLFFFDLKKFLLLSSYSCMPFLPIPPPHPSWTHLPPPPPPWYIYTMEFYAAERKKELIPFATEVLFYLVQYDLKCWLYTIIYSNIDPD